MTIEQLKVLNAIITRRSFKAASEFVKRSQPAISIAIKNLEDELKFKVFSRAHFRAELTPEGRAFYNKARGILEEFEKLENFGKYISDGNEHLLRIGVEVLCRPSILNPVLSTFSSKFSQTRLEVEFIQVGEAAERLLEDKIDLAISSFVKKHSKIEEIPFSTLNMLPVISPDHPLAKSKEEVDDNDLREHVQISLDRNGDYSITSQLGFVEDSTLWSVCDLNTNKQLIKEGYGWGYLPQNMILGELESGTLVRLRASSKKQNRIMLKGLRKAGENAGKVKKMLWDQIRLLGTSNVQMM